MPLPAAYQTVVPAITTSTANRDTTRRGRRRSPRAIRIAATVRRRRFVIAAIPLPVTRTPPGAAPVPSLAGRDGLGIEPWAEPGLHPVTYDPRRSYSAGGTGIPGRVGGCPAGGAAL